MHRITASPTGRSALAAMVAILWSCACHAAEATLQEKIERVLAEESLTGIAWTLIEESGEATTGFAGLRDNEDRLAFSPDTRVHVGSVAKTLLSTGVLRLATEGRVDLDAPVLGYLPELLPGDRPAGFSDVTVRHLLDHTAGLDDARLWQVFSEHADADAPLVAALPDPHAQLRVRSEPGSRFSYSNTGYTLLGMIIEAVVGERYEAYLDRHLLVPLAMHDSTFAFTTQAGDGADPTLAWGHVDDGSRYAARPLYFRPASQFTTTTADLARFAGFLLGDGAVDGRVFIDEALMRSRGTPVGTEAANAGLTAGYGLGMGRRDRHGVVGNCHGGNTAGFVAMLCVFPDERKAFAYSVNTDSESADYSRLDGLFVEALGIAAAPVPRTTASSPAIEEWHGRYVPSPNRFRMFEYLDTVFGAIAISAGDGALQIASLQQGTRRLRPVGERLYSADDRATASHVLLRGDDGEYLLSDGFRTFEKVSAAYLFAHWTSLFLGLAGLLWLLVAGSISLVRHRSAFLRRPEAPAFFATALLPAPLPLFLMQSFSALGDLTPASAMLAAVTLLLPTGMLWTVVIVSKTWHVSRLYLLHGLAAIFVLQWCAVLTAADMLPLRLWA